MTFLQPILLFGLPLILVPVVIHLLNRLRHRTQQWAAMRFLVAASRSSVSKAKLKQFLILLFRTLAVLMLLLFLARPLSGGWMGWAFASAPDTVLILLDRSSSMETRLAATSLSRREQALELLEQAASAYMGHSHFVLIDSASSQAQTVTNMEALKEHAMVEPTDTATNMPSLLQRSLQWLIDNQAGTTEIWIASDLQRSNWQPTDDRWGSLMKQFENLPQSLRFRLLAVNEQTEQDVGVQLADLKITSTAEGRFLRLVADVSQSQLTEESLTATRTINGLSAGVQIPMEAAQVRWQDQWDLGTKEEAGWGSLTLPADGNSRNNALHFVYGKALSQQALTLASHTYVGQVLSLASGRITVGGLEPAALTIDPKGAALPVEGVSLITWQGAFPEGNLAQQLNQFASEGGVVVCFPDYFTTPSDNSFAGVRWLEMETAPNFGSFTVGRWEKDTGPLADTNEGLSIPLDQLEVLKRRRLQHSDSVIAAFSDGEPLLVHQKTGQGSIYFVSTLPIGDWSGLDQGPVLLPMLQRLSQDGTRRLENTLFWTCGEISDIDLEAGWQPVDEGSDRQMAWHAGVYRLGDRLAAVNTPASEYDLGITPPEEVQPLFEGQNFQLFQETSGQENTQLQGEVWRVFLFLMLLFLLVESWLMMTGPGTVATPSFVKKPQPSTAGATS